MVNFEKSVSCCLTGPGVREMLRLPEAGLLEIMPGDHPDYEVKSLYLLSLLTVFVQYMECSFSIDNFLRGPLVRFFKRASNK